MVLYLDSHFNLFPRSLSELLNSHGVLELHLSLTHGLWRHNEWGSYPTSTPEAPPGAELWAWFSPNSLNSSEIKYTF